MISLPDTNTLMAKPSADGRIAFFPSENTDLLKIDWLFEAGSAYQQQPLCASAASKLYTLATANSPSTAVAEFFDFRGVILETNCDVYQSTLTLYMLRRHAEEVLPMIEEMFSRPAFSEDDYKVWQSKRYEEISTLEHRTAPMARRQFYQSLFGERHPLGRYATPQDVQKLQIATIKDFWHRHYDLGCCRIVAAGAVDERLNVLLHKPESFNAPMREYGSIDASATDSLIRPQALHYSIKDATQTSLRIGRILPIAWDSMDYARLIILTTLLGGYFGSRLMANIREDKGLTYGIYARTQIYRGAIVFYITADVAGGMADKAVQEILNELRRLADERVGEDELALVKNVLVGDFLRSVDGVFELSTRYCDMLANGVDERLTDNLRRAVNETTATELQELAQRLLRVEDMTVCTAGV